MPLQLTWLTFIYDAYEISVWNSDFQQNKRGPRPTNRIPLPTMAHQRAAAHRLKNTVLDEPQSKLTTYEFAAHNELKNSFNIFIFWKLLLSKTGSHPNSYSCSRLEPTIFHYFYRNGSGSKYFLLDKKLIYPNYAVNMGWIVYHPLFCTKKLDGFSFNWNNFRY